LCERVGEKVIAIPPAPVLKAKNQPDGLDSGIITSIELRSPRRQHLAARDMVILNVTQSSLSETLLWHARAGQARRVAGMLSSRDAALREAPIGMAIMLLSFTRRARI
jgi:hypothetical protein